MKRTILAVLVGAVLATCAQASLIPTLTLLPANGVVAGKAGTVVGWGFTLTYTGLSDWVVLTGSEFTGSEVYGNYVDYLSLGNAPLYVAGPSPESSTIEQSWDSSSNPLLGLGEFDINSTALPGADIPGDIVVHYSVFSEDPTDPAFDPDTSTVVADATVSDSAQVDVTPEPAPLLTMSAALLLFGCAGWRHHKSRRV